MPKALTLTLLTTFLGAASALGQSLPVTHPDREGWSVPGLPTNRIELRLVPDAARRARAAGPASDASAAGAPRVRLGVASVDRVAAELGAWFEPEFPGERPPTPGSNATDFTAFLVAHLPADAALEVALARFRSLPEVASVSPIAVLRVAGIPNDSLWSSAYWLYQPPERRDIHAPEAWDYNIGDTSIVVAILDTGVIPYHPDLAGRFWTNPLESVGVPGMDDDGNGKVDDVHGWDFVALTSNVGLPVAEDWRDEDPDPNDFAGHGTSVAGLLGAIGNNTIGLPGVTWQSRLMPLRIGWSTRGSPGGLVDMLFVARAIRYATQNGAHVINCSFETLNTDGLYAAADEAVRAGVIIVSASGNSGGPHELAQREDVIAIAASDAADQVERFSNLGDFVDLVAPGRNLASTYIAHAGTDSVSARQPFYVDVLTGTSYAAPLAAGVAALVQSSRKESGLPRLGVMGMLLRLCETSDDIAALNAGLSGYGTGRLNAFRALTDPLRSTASGFGAATVGAASVIGTTRTPALAVYAASNDRLVIMRGRDDTLAVAPLPGTPLGGTAAALLGAGRGLGIFVATWGQVSGFDAAGRPLAGWPVAADPGTDSFTGGPALGDLDGDGALEVVCGSVDGTVWAWHGDGTRVTGFPASVALSEMSGTVALADLDGIAGVEIVVCSSVGRLNVIRFDGTPMPGWPRTIDMPPTSPAIAKLAAGEPPTVVVAAGNRVRAFRPDGTQRFAVTIPGTAATDVAIGDLDRDGVHEIVVATTSPATLTVLDSAGVALPGWPLSLAATPVGSPAIAPLESEWTLDPEILIMLPTGLVAFTSAAQPISEFPKPGGAGRDATVCRVDGSTSSQVLAGTGTDGSLYVYDAGPASALGTFEWPTPRANFARTGNRDDLAFPVLDVDAPLAVTDLVVDSVGARFVALEWHAPADDLGAATAYDLRYSTAPIDAGSFTSASVVPGVPAPAEPGTIERFVVGGLAEGLTYYFAIRSVDASGNRSPISNVVAGTTGGGAPGRVLDLVAPVVSDTSVTLLWNAPGDDGPVGRPTIYLVRATTVPLDSAAFEATPLAQVLMATAAVGEEERIEFGGLVRAREYWFAVVAVDELGNRSPLSNVVHVTTDAGGSIRGRALVLASRVQPSRLPVELFWRVPSGPAGGARIELHDVGGRRLRSLPLGSESSGVAQWNGRDEEGHLVPAGIYFARLRSGSVHVQTRVVLLP